jgi:hypothetical protein
MTYYVVIDDNGKTHFVEAPSPGDAINKIPGGESVRLAQQFDISKHLNKEKEE